MTCPTQFPLQPIPLKGKHSASSHNHQRCGSDSQPMNTVLSRQNAIHNQCSVCTAAILRPGQLWLQQKAEWMQTSCTCNSAAPLGGRTCRNRRASHLSSRGTFKTFSAGKSIIEGRPVGVQQARKQYLIYVLWSVSPRPFGNLWGSAIGPGWPTREAGCRIASCILRLEQHNTVSGSGRHHRPVPLQH